jgi:hypothetical protein
MMVIVRWEAQTQSLETPWVDDAQTEERTQYSMSKPTPLSRTSNTNCYCVVTAVNVISGEEKSWQKTSLRLSSKFWDQHDCRRSAVTISPGWMVATTVVLSLTLGGGPDQVR